MTKDALRTRAAGGRPRDRMNPAQVFCVVVGASLVAAGVLGFFYNADFSTGASTTDPANRDAVLGVLDVNGWHNVVHLLTGAAALAFAPSPSAARGYAVVFGLAYALVATLGFAYGDGDSIFKLIPVNTEDNVLHVLFAVTGVAAGVASRQVPRPSTA
jgi:nitrate/nitrite transporter NarK